MDYTKHLYLILYPNPSLVASQLAPKAFADHYQIGSTRFYNGKLIFAEIDPGFRHPYFELESLLKQVVEHSDGTPKATKFIKSYRVLEHIELSAIQRLYLTTPSGEMLGLDSADEPKPTELHIRVLAEVCPLSMLVLTRLNSRDFGEYITEPKNPKGAPSLFYTQLDLDEDAFLKAFERNPFMPAPFEFLHPSKLRDAIMEMKSNTAKITKGVALRASMDRISYKQILHGYWFARQGESKFFAMPQFHDIERTNFRFWRSM
ncbi:MAG: hypothetical protein HQ523_02115 [Lentisphaerae bacterium]|nr:hypothetical protein [Lentisphaerota bacterium]